MSYEIGFTCLNAMILLSDMLRNVITSTEKYEREKDYVSKLLTARHEILTLDGPTVELLNAMIKKELNQWWYDSWYNVQIDNIRVKIMDFIRAELSKKKIKILSENYQTFTAEYISGEDFDDIQQAFNQAYRDFDLYYDYIE